MKIPRVLFWAISMMLLMFILVLVTPLIYEDYKLSFEASRYRQILKSSPLFANLQVIPCNRKFKGLLVQGSVASDQDFDLLEKRLRSSSGVSFSLSVNIGQRVREMYIFEAGKGNGDIGK